LNSWPISATRPVRRPPSTAPPASPTCPRECIGVGGHTNPGPLHPGQTPPRQRTVSVPAPGGAAVVPRSASSAVASSAVAAPATTPASVADRDGLLLVALLAARSRAGCPVVSSPGPASSLAMNAWSGRPCRNNAGPGAAKVGGPGRCRWHAGTPGPGGQARASVPLASCSALFFFVFFFGGRAGLPSPHGKGPARPSLVSDTGSR